MMRASALRFSILMHKWLCLSTEIATPVSQARNDYPRKNCHCEEDFYFSRHCEEQRDEAISSNQHLPSTHYGFASRCRARHAFLGRSMIEMLGVLAIIGVLSVGGIAGYSKAMFEYKANILKEQISTLINSLNNHKEKLAISGEDDSEYYLVEVLDAMNELPDGMYYNKNLLKDVFENWVRVYHIQKHKYTGVHISFKPDNNGYAMCRNYTLISQALHDSIFSASIGVTDSNYEGELGHYLYGDNGCTPSRNCLKDATLTDIENMCRQCDNDEDGKCNFYIIVYKY